MQKFCLRLLSDESKILPLSITAASLKAFELAGDAHNSFGWEIELRIGRCLMSKTSGSNSTQPNRKRKTRA